MSSKTASPARTETSLNISETGRDSSTPLGMTKKVHERTRAILRAFTIIELLVVIAIIIILAGLILSTVGYVQKKGARSRAEAEIAAISAALENYKADNGIYPRGNANLGNTTPYDTDKLTAVTDSTYTSKTPPDPKPSPTPGYNPDDVSYKNASFFLYGQLSGNTNGDRTTQTQTAYFQFKPNMLSPAGGTGTVTAIRDPFGNSYGYSTAKQANSANGFNPTFDLWSTAGTTNASGSAYEAQWIKNW
jgi:type II secretory pathway pseudopilin PulG